MSDVVEADLEKFEASIREWSELVQNEIAIREQVSDNAQINEYNGHVVFGLKLAYAMMQESMKRQIDLRG